MWLISVYQNCPSTSFSICYMLLSVEMSKLVTTRLAGALASSLLTHICHDEEHFVFFEITIYLYFSLKVNFSCVLNHFTKDF